MNKMLISKWEVVLGVRDRVNIPCLMHDTRLCQYDVKMTNDLHGPNKMCAMQAGDMPDSLVGRVASGDYNIL